jgi:hypothetical protein
MKWQQPVQITRHKRMLFDKYNVPASILPKAAADFPLRGIPSSAIESKRFRHRA